MAEPEKKMRRQYKILKLIIVVICAQRVNQVYKMRSPSIVLMLDQRRRRWPSIETTLGRRFMYVEKSIDYLRELMTSLTFSDPV